MNTSSSSPPYPLCSIVWDAPTCDEDAPCSSSYSFYDLTYKFMQVSEIIDEEEEINEIIEHPFHSLWFK